MSLKLVTINVNGLRDNRKRELVFNWLVSKKYDCICLQETHCTGVDTNPWESEWKTQGGGASAWLCGSSESKGVAILLSKHFAFDINFNFSDKTGRLLTCEINTENAVFHIFNIYAPNLCSDRKQFFDSFQNISYNHEDDSIYHYNNVLGDFNCILDKKIDRYPNRRTDDIGKIELQNLITRYDLYDAWRKIHPNKKRYSFQRGNAKSRIDFILCSNGLSSKVFDTNIKHFPFSDHDSVSTKLKLDDIERGPGIWAMNFNTITSELFTKAFNTWWGKWKNEIERFRNIQEWWDVTKTKIKYLTMQISKQLKKGQNKKDIEKFEKQLEDLKSSTDDGDIIKGKILELENLIKKYYTQKAEAAKIRSRIKWAEEGERSTRYFFELEKKQGENKMWNRIKNTESKYKYDIDSIIDEQIKFYSKLFTTEGWDENSANKLTQHIESKLNVDEKETLELDVSIDEIKNVLKILKPNKSPGEDGIISEFYITHWEQIKDEFFLLVNDTFEKRTNSFTI